mgnify:CR=1 FL=1
MITATTKQKVLSNRAYMFHWFEYVYFIQGLALINGTQFITSLGVEALERAANVTDAANAIAAMSLEVLKGTTRAFDEGKCYTSLYIHVLITSLRKHLLNTIWSKNAVLDSPLRLYLTKDTQRDWVTKFPQLPIIRIGIWNLLIHFIEFIQCNVRTRLIYAMVSFCNKTNTGEITILINLVQ